MNGILIVIGNMIGVQPIGGLVPPPPIVGELYTLENPELIYTLEGNLQIYILETIPSSFIITESGNFMITESLNKNLITG